MENIYTPSFRQRGSDYLSEGEEECLVVDTDPTGRFQRYQKCLGMGASKKVYLAYDQEEGVEVAWNELRVDNVQKADVLKILSEVQILQQIRHESIINFYHSWISRRNGKDQIIFITELMTSGTLKSFVKKANGPIKTRALKNWCRQILKGLDYLHSRKPSIIHRDLKCDNIFVNGNNGQAKIGDLGLAIAKNSLQATSVLGTPEFMAPELYDEKYDEKIDVYSFGMCMIEMITKEYPYSECTNQAQIYRKVTSQILPKALDKIVDSQARRIIEMCLAYDPNKRPSPKELLADEFFLNPIIKNNVSGLSKAFDSTLTLNTDGQPLESSSLPSSSLVSPVSLTSNKSNILFYDFDSSNNWRHKGNSNTIMIGSNLLETLIINLEIVEVRFPIVTIRMITMDLSKNYTGTKQEIKFPYDLKEDTVGQVVHEMINEGVLLEVDRVKATKKIVELISAFLSPRVESEELQVRHLKTLRSRSRSLNCISAEEAFRKGRERRASQFLSNP